MKHIFSIGDIIEGRVTGIQNYGIFVQLDDETQGLVHISECKHGFITNIDDVIKVNQKLKVRIIDIDEYTGKISLSTRVLQSLNTPPFPLRIRHTTKRKNPKIGFRTLEKVMPKFIESALQDIKTDKLKINS